MAEIKGGITVSGGSVDSMPVILDGRKSIYEEAIEKGIIDTNTTYEQFLESLSIKPNEIKKAVKDLVDENLEKKVNQAVAVAVAMLDLSKIPTQPAPTQPAPAQPAPAQPAPAQPVPAQPSTETPSSSVDLSDEAFDEINKLLGNN
jgi:hypothetical protein|nr:MAG TPA: Huntingtin protein-like protein [Caudoviricetes sp.]